MQRHVAWLVVLSALLDASHTSAHLPALYGRSFMLFDPAEAETMLAGSGSDGETDSPDADLEPYDEQLEQAQDAAGPYGQGLVEPLYSKGYHYRSQGDYDEAIETYLRALHVTRINDGLTSKRQKPILRELMAAYRDSGQPRSLDQDYEYLFRLYDLGTELDDDSLHVSLQ